MTSLETIPRISVPKDDTAPPAYAASPASGSPSRPLSRASFSSQTSSLPGYDDATATADPGLSPSDAAFAATAAFQIQTPGKRWFSFPAAPTAPDPIPVYAVSPSAPAAVPVADASGLVIPKYVSLRRTRGSGNCVLIHGASFPDISSPAALDPQDAPVLAATQYRFGLGKPPKLRLYAGASGPSPLDAFEAMHAARKGDNPDCKTPDEAWALDAAGAGQHPAFELQSAGDRKTGFTTDFNPVSFRSRAIRFSTPLGTFQWRYASRPERKAFGAPSVLVFERLVRIAPAYPSSSAEASTTLRVPVGFFVRSDETRSPGTSRSTAGNGGRLLLDLRAWDPKEPTVPTAEAGDEADGVVDEKRRLMAADEASAEALEAMERIAITSCLCMLKKEVDRRRMYQAIMLSGAAGGGP